MLSATNTKATVSPLEIDEEFVHVTPPASPNQPDRENKSNASISIDMHASALAADRLASVSNSQLNISGELKEDAAENKISALTTSMNINEMLIKSLDAAVIKIISEELSNMKHTHDKTVLLNKMSKNLLTMSQNNLKKVEEQRIINSYNKTKNFLDDFDFFPGYNRNLGKISAINMSATFLTFYKKALKANEGNEAFLTAGYLILTLATFNFMCRNDDLRFNTKEYIYEQTQQRKMIMSSNNLFYKTFNRLAKPVPFIESITPQQAGSKWYLVRSALVQQITENKFKLLMLANCNLFERLVYDTCRSDSDESNFSLTAMMLIFKIYVFALLMTKASLLDDTLMEPGRAIERHKNFRKVLLDIMEPICDGVVKVWETLAELRNNAKVNHAATVEEIIVDIGQSNVELESENDKLQAEIDKLQAQSKSSEMEIPVEVKTASISKTTSSNDNESEDMKAELSLRRRRSYG